MATGTSYGKTIDEQLRPAREAAARNKATLESMELGRLQRENERLQGEVYSLQQQRAADAIQAATAKVGPAVEAAIQQLHQQAAPPRQQPATPPPATPEDLSKLSTPELIRRGLEQSTPAAPGGRPADPVAAAAPSQDFSQLSPVQQITAALREQGTPQR